MSMHSKSKKWIANITVIVMVLALIPAAAFAATSTTWSQAGYDNVSETWTPGNLVKYYEGSYVPYRANAEGFVPTSEYIDFDLDYMESQTGALGYDQATDWFIGPSVPYSGSPTIYTKAEIDAYAQANYGKSIIEPDTQFMGADAFTISNPVELTSGGLAIPAGYTGDTLLRYHMAPNLLGYTNGDTTAAAGSFINALMTWYGGDWTIYYVAHLAESGAPNLFEGGIVKLGAGAYAGSSLHVTFSQAGAKTVPLPTNGLDKREILVEKTWANINDAEPVTIKLIGQNGEAGTPYVASTITLDGTVDTNANPEYAAWKGKFVNVPIYYVVGKDIFPITYSITEDPVPAGFLTPVYGGSAVDGFTVHNAYIISGSGNVAITKELTGGKTLAADMFSFTITQTNSAWITTNGGYTQTVKNLADGTIPFSAIGYTAAGTYYYVIHENAGSIDGITYDTDTIKVTMTVTYDGKGKLTAVPSYTGGQAFTNVYNTSGSGNVAVTKDLTGMELTDDMFSFTITQTGTDLGNPYTETVKNLADGTIPFSAIDYTVAGIYTYAITEDAPSTAIPGISYDSHVISVTMTVTDDGKGHLTAIPSYDGGQVFTNSYEGPGKITVTKKVVVLTDDETIKVNYSFYAALFEQQEGQLVRVSDIKKLEVVDSGNAVVTFDKLDLDKTYLVYETDSEGNIIQTEADGTIVTPIIPDWIEISYENAVVTLTPNILDGETVITNVFEPEDFPLYGSITVNKKVTVNGKPFASNRTFYVALFADKELTDMVSEIKPLKMNGNSSTSTEFLTDIDGNPLEAGTTYYIAETDKDGVPLTGTFEELGFEIDIDKTEVVIIEEGTTVNIINKFKSEEFPLTGDNFNVNLWLFLAMLGVAGAIAPVAFRKKEDANN